MKTAVIGVRHWFEEVVGSWNRFWFAPSEPHTLAAIRIVGGLMILYTHLVWAKDLMAFLGPDSWMTTEASRKLHSDLAGQDFTWTYLTYVTSPTWLWTLHIAALVVMAMLTLGLFTRVTSVLTWFITICYCHRLEGALFGLDQVNAMLAMYLMVGACGDAYSLDRWLLKRRTSGELPIPIPKVSTTIAVRLLQVHLCVIYLFGGISKLRGEMWWDGSACWFAIANLEYQSWDVTWLIQWRWLIALLSHITIFWETFYPVLVWPKLTRPIMLCCAVAVHGGIALFLGMKTFGLAMIIANMAFLSPPAIRWFVSLFRPTVVVTNERIETESVAPARRKREVSRR